MPLSPLPPAGGRYLVRPPAPATASTEPPRAAVVVPARNEAARIVPCLEALRCQWSAQHGNLHDTFAVVLIINGTTDATAYEVTRWAAANPQLALTAVDVDFAQAEAHVGSARALALSLGSALLRGEDGGPVRDTSRALLFSTDADSRLAYDAVARGLDELTRADSFGAHILAGEPDPSEIGRLFNRYGTLKARLRHQLFPAPYDRHPPHGVFGGAGFGVSLGAYEAVGGLPVLPFDEDQVMRRRLLNRGFRVSHPRDVIVYTSTRFDGRTPWGMARQLAAWEEDQAAGRVPSVPAAAGLTYKYRLKRALRDGDQGVASRFRLAPELLSTLTEQREREGFEGAWHSLWSCPAVATSVTRRFPLRPIPAAILTLETLFPSAHTVTLSPRAGVAAGRPAGSVRAGVRRGA